jgi:hypothetical protein
MVILVLGGGLERGIRSRTYISQAHLKSSVVGSFLGANTLSKIPKVSQLNHRPRNRFTKS